jgi:hypothetical protein
MNKTVMFITFAVLVLVAFVGSVVLLVVRPDASATFIGQVVQLLGLVTVAAGTFAGIGKLGGQVEQVRSQTNGTLSKLSTERDAALAELARRDGKAAAELIVPEPGAPFGGGDVDAQRTNYGQDAPPRHRM